MLIRSQFDQDEVNLCNIDNVFNITVEKNLVESDSNKMFLIMAVRNGDDDIILGGFKTRDRAVFIISTMYEMYRVGQRCYQIPEE